MYSPAERTKCFDEKNGGFSDKNFNFGALPNSAAMISPISGALLFRLLPFLLVVSIQICAAAQPGISDPEKTYGLDQSIINGRRLIFRPPPGTAGHPYLQSNLFSTGTVFLSGTAYPGQAINYDIYRQQLLLRYADNQSPFNVIEVSKARLNGFDLDSRHFELLFPYSDTCFYQVIGTGSIKFAYLWSRKLDLSTTSGNSAYYFSKPERSLYLLREGKLLGFRSNRGLTRLFGREFQPEIREYLRQHKIRVRKSPDEVMERLAGFLGTLK